MFQVTVRPSSGETTVFMRHLVLVILCGWLSVMQGAPCITDSHPHRITSTKRHINTDVSPDDGRTVSWNMQRLISILRIKCAPSWLYLQDWGDSHLLIIISSKTLC